MHFKGTVYRDGSDWKCSSLKEEMRRFFSKFCLYPILWEPFKVSQRHLVLKKWLLGHFFQSAEKNSHRRRRVKTKCVDRQWSLRCNSPHFSVLLLWKTPACCKKVQIRSPISLAMHNFAHLLQRACMRQLSRSGDVLIRSRFRIRESVPLDYGSGSCSFLQWLSRC